ncbi:MAG TPA: sugar phosphate isomerase/epimerase [Candidatus Methylacidiphilales bacterium]
MDAMRAARGFSLGYSTMGDAALTFEEACGLAVRFGLDAVELRALGGGTDLPGYFAAHGWPATVPPVSIPVVGTSLSLLSATEADLDAFFALAEVAARLKAPYLRVFGEGGAPFTASLGPEELEIAAHRVVELREGLAAQGLEGIVEPLLETHDVFSSSERCLALNRLLAANLCPPVPILWDSHHTWCLAGEEPEATWAALGPLVRHVHYKDSVSDAAGKEGFRYVVPGAGEFPGGRLAALLRGAGFAGVVSLEWERLWHPELPPLAEALPPFASGRAFEVNA